MRILTISILILLISTNVYAAPCPAPWPNNADFEFPFHDSILNIDKTYKVPPHILIGGFARRKWEKTETEGVSKLHLEGTTIYARSFLTSSYELPGLHTPIVESGLLDGQILQEPNSQFKLQVDYNYEYQPGPTSVTLIQPNIHFRKRDVCLTEKTVSFKETHHHGNLNELGMLAFIYIGTNPEQLKEQIRPFLVKRMKGSVSFHLNRYKDADKPFCVAIEIMDITGQRSPLSSPLCLDPTDESAPYISGEDAPGRVGCSSTTQGNKSHSIWLAVLVLLSCFGNRKRLKRHLDNLSK